MRSWVQSTIRCRFFLGFPHDFRVEPHHLRCDHPLQNDGVCSRCRLHHHHRIISNIVIGMAHVTQHTLKNPDNDPIDVWCFESSNKPLPSHLAAQYGEVIRSSIPFWLCRRRRRCSLVSRRLWARQVKAALGNVNLLFLRQVRTQNGHTKMYFSIYSLRSPHALYFLIRSLVLCMFIKVWFIR